MRAVRYATICGVVLSIVLCSSSFAAIRTAVVPSASYRLLAPYHYNPATPYLPGQRRGVLVSASQPVIPAFMSGTVSFAGFVAGRGVVSVRERLGNGVDVVATYVGVRPGVQVGQRVARGTTLGLRAAGYVHLGLRIRNDRHGYVPLAVGTDRMLGSRRARALHTRSAHSKPAHALAAALERIIAGQVAGRIDVRVRAFQAQQHIVPTSIEPTGIPDSLPSITRNLSSRSAHGIHVGNHAASWSEGSRHGESPTGAHAAGQRHMGGRSLIVERRQRGAAHRINTVTPTASEVLTHAGVSNNAGMESIINHQSSLFHVAAGIAELNRHSGSHPRWGVINASTSQAELPQSPARDHAGGSPMHSVRRNWWFCVLVVLFMFARRVRRTASGRRHRSDVITVRSADILEPIHETFRLSVPTNAPRMNTFGARGGSMTKSGTDRVMHSRHQHFSAHTRQDA